MSRSLSERDREKLAGEITKSFFPSVPAARMASLVRGRNRPVPQTRLRLRQRMTSFFPTRPSFTAPPLWG